jgi:hypothetical protein
MRAGRARRALASALVALPLFAFSFPVQAVNVQSLFNDLCQYHVLDNDTCSAKTLIDCLVKSGGGAGMQQCAADYDPKAKKFIDIYVAATKPQYVRLIELAGPVVACKFLPPGPPSDVLCSTALRPIIEKAFDKAARIYEAALSGNWLKVIYLVGDPTIACDVVPGFPGKEITCGAVAQILSEGGKLLKQGAAAGVDALEGGAEALGNLAVSGLQSIGLGKPGVAVETTFYNMQGKPRLHQRVLKRLTSKTTFVFLGFEDPLMKQCIDFASYGGSQMSFATAACKAKSQQLHDEATALAKLVAVAPGAYFENIKATAAHLVATNYWSGTDKFIAAFKVLPQTQWSAEGFQTLPPPFSAVLANCVANTKTTFPVPLAPELTGPLTPPHMWGWVCRQAANNLMLELLLEKKRLATVVIPALGAAGCTVAKNTDGTLKFDCHSFAALAACQSMFGAASPQSRCHVSALANQKLAKDIAATLGSKRCQVAGTNVACTRPWKHDQCLAALAKAKLAAPTPAQVSVQCLTKDQLKGEPAYPVVAKQAQDILNVLNGVKKIGGVQTPGGGTAGVVLVPPVKPCKHGFDPLAISCPGNPKAPSEAGVKLTACAADPNKDGADAPCYAGPLSVDSGSPVAKAGSPVSAGIAPQPPNAGKPPDTKRSPFVPTNNAPAGAYAGGRTPLAVPPSMPRAPARTGPAGAPDLAATNAATLIGRNSRKALTWGGSIATGDAEAAAAADGTCRFALHYELRNGGNVASGPFQSVLGSGGTAPVTRAHGALAMGATASAEVMIALRPGNNVVTLTVDSSNQVAESNEGNNAVRVAILVNGSCAPGSTTRTPAAGTATPDESGARGRLHPPARP